MQAPRPLDEGVGGKGIYPPIYIYILIIVIIIIITINTDPSIIAGSWAKKESEDQEKVFRGFTSCCWLGSPAPVVLLSRCSTVCVLDCVCVCVSMAVCF